MGVRKATRHPVVIYGRVSQVRDERSKSVDDQLAELRRWAGREGWPIYAERRDDNVSASRYAARTGRDGWSQVMADLASGKVRALLVWEFSRSTRDLRVYIALEEACRAHGVLLGYSGRLHDLTTADGGFSAGLDALLAAKESAMTSERTRRAVESRAAGGRPHGSVPYGYRRTFDPHSGKVTGREVDPDTGPVVAEVVRRLLAGESAQRIARDLNQRGVLTTRGAQWTGANLSKLALRPAYAGLRVHHGEVLDDVTATWPPIITRADHDRLRALYGAPDRDKFRKDTRVKHLGAGLYRCGRDDCDGVMRRVAHRGGMYDCRTCHRTARRQQPVDELVEAVLVGRLSRPDVLEVLAGPDRADDRATARAEVARLRAEEADTRRLLSAGDLTPADVAAWRRGWAPRLEAAETAAAPPAVPGAVAELAGPGAAARWSAASIEVRRAVLDALMVVTIMPVGRASVRFDPSAVRIDWRTDE